jgi:hypothetical protein
MIHTDYLAIMEVFQLKRHRSYRMQIWKESAAYIHESIVYSRLKLFS